MYTSQGKIDKSGPSDLLMQYAPLVRRLALQLIAKLPASVELDDLIQVGMMGLLDAGNRYKDDQGAKFETYASQRIRGAMLDELRANDWVSRGLRQSSRSVARAVQAQEQKLGRPATEGEIAQELELSLDAYQHLLQEIQGCQLVYYDDFDQGDQENSFLDRQALGVQSLADEPLTQLLRGDFRRQLIEAIELMPERERLLLSLYYDEELNLREIGAVLEVTQSRVCQLHSQAISRLRASLGDSLDSLKNAL
ncbi:MAG: RNA polymerase sigma factor FliA [Polaromonas sp.]|uniref:RNA polymerase sigma factor FliA n=1 Tax=Polaromonas sp. TaxID=1869339 RepID=UPI0027309992|nr:RNA polymerase sigma factor FliA [Polaromonas sp.]MDP2448754.1 RNA polymerase sigma factor FliA [Polaromonas sp.]MDP3248137.1 RNA polymerase sigma factor FliA [Polaromonas sp.]MDP3754849.1 RNA polymerase sigma factor FliA [Polaromonas sp.]